MQAGECAPIGIRRAEDLVTPPSLSAPPLRTGVFAFVDDSRSANGSTRGGGGLPASNSSGDETGSARVTFRSDEGTHSSRRRRR
mgnify:CR=1 FL=1